MPLKQRDIDELKKLYKQEYNEELSNQEAWEMGTRLLDLVFTVLSSNSKKKRSKRILRK